MFKRVKTAIKASFGITQPTVPAQVTKTQINQFTSDLIGKYISSIDPDKLPIELIYERLYKEEPEAGGAIDRVSTLARSTFKGFKMCTIPTFSTDITKEELDKYFNGSGSDDPSTLTDDEKRTLFYAEVISNNIKTPDIIESYVELLLMSGNVFIEHNETLTDRVLPAANITLLDSVDQMKSGVLQDTYEHCLKEGNILVVDENSDSPQIITKFTHIKYKTTPVYVTDNMNRKTFGLYSISPQERTLLPIWRKRLLEAIDIIWRSKSVPREHHKLKNTNVNLASSSGATIEERTANARSAASSTLSTYANKVANISPDQKYISFDDVEIDAIQSNHSQLGSEEAIEACRSQVWTSLNTPKSIVSGEGSASYAAELIISNYVTIKVLQLVDKVQRPIVENIKRRILLLDPTLPVNRLEMKYELTMASSMIEVYRQFKILVDSGLFTDTELREVVNYLPLTNDQKKYIFTGEGSSRVTADTMKGSSLSPDYPETPQSDVQHTRDPGQESTFDYDY